MSWTSLTSTGFAIVGLATVLTAAKPERAAAATEVGYVWANCPTCTSAYTPDSLYSYNSSGGAITVTPISTGFYEVQFNGLGNALHSNNVQVTAYDTNGYCMSSGWDQHSSGNTRMFVSCFDASGALANSFFTLLYQQRAAKSISTTAAAAFLWADEPTTASYKPDSLYNYNSTGGTNTIVRNGTGNYTATLPGLTTLGGDVQVTAYNGFDITANPARCAVVVWLTSSAGTTVTVQCYDSTGAVADEEFSLSFNIGRSAGFVSGAVPNTGVYAWANNPTDTHLYKPNLFYRYNGFKTGALTAESTGTGQYRVNIPGSISYNHSQVLVTGYNSSNAGYCNVTDWGTQIINVGCYDLNGNAQDSDFDVEFITSQ